MRWHKFISAILHPVVMPSIGVLLYIFLLPHQFNSQQKYTVLSIIIVATYIIPSLMLILLKSLGYIKDYRVHSIKERKIPLFVMITIFYVLGKLFNENSITRDLSYLFYGTLLGLVITYFTYFFKVKTSLHLLSIGSAIGFFINLQILYSLSILPLIIVLIILSGLLGTSRLYLKAHTPREVYLGFSIGMLCQFITFYTLQ